MVSCFQSDSTYAAQIYRKRTHPTRINLPSWSNEQFCEESEGSSPACSWVVSTAPWKATLAWDTKMTLCICPSCSHSNCACQVLYLNRTCITLSINMCVKLIASLRNRDTFGIFGSFLSTFVFIPPPYSFKTGLLAYICNAEEGVTTFSMFNIFVETILRK